jgi:hypothetical protein
LGKRRILETERLEKNNEGIEIEIEKKEKGGRKRK